MVPDAAAYPDMEQSVLRPTQSLAPGPGWTVSSVWVLGPQADPERFVRTLAAAGDGSLIDATHGETTLASLLLAILENSAGKAEPSAGSDIAGRDKAVGEPIGKLRWSTGFTAPALACLRLEGNPPRVAAALGVEGRR